MSQICAGALKAPVSPLDVRALQHQLQSSPYWSLRQLICQVDKDRVVVCGTLPSYYLKQIAQSLAAKTVGMEHVCSDIEV